MVQDMDFQYTKDRIVLGGKHLTLLDDFVIGFIRVLEPHTPYVIVSGYVAILFGRSRGTEDIDILIPPLGRESFDKLHATLLLKGYEFLNAEDAGGLWEMLRQHMGIRVAQKDCFIPNIELKFLKDEVDRRVFSGRVLLDIPGAGLYISPVDIQIAYKLYLGSEKDIEDALYLYEIFKNDLDRTELKTWMETFRVRGDDYGIEL